MSRRQHAFTLVEIMVALGVFAVISLTVYGRLGEVADQTRTLEQRTLGAWVARNRAEALRLEYRDAPALPAPGRRRDQVSSAGRSWEVNTEILGTDDVAMRRLEITVRERAGPEATDAPPAFVLVGFLGQT